MAFKAIVQATQDTWSRKTRRRKRQMQDPLNENMGGENASTEVSETSENLRGLAEEMTSPKPFHSSSMSSPVPELTLASAPILIVGIGAYILHLSDPVPTIEEGSLLHPGLPGLSTHTGLGEQQGRQLPQDSHPTRAWMLVCTWRQGSGLRTTPSTREGEGGRAIFEGFWSYVCRKLGGLLSEANVDEASLQSPRRCRRHLAMVIGNGQGNGSGDGNDRGYIQSCI